MAQNEPHENFIDRFDNPGMNDFETQIQFESSMAISAVFA